MIVGQGVAFDQCDGRWLLSGYLPGERKANLRETLARHADARLAGANGLQVRSGHLCSVQVA